MLDTDGRPVGWWGVHQEAWHRRVSESIARDGFHGTVVAAGCRPRFAYTVGLTEQGLPELIFAGGIAFEPKQAMDVLSKLAAHVLGARTFAEHPLVARRSALHPSLGVPVDLGPTLGAFTFAPVDSAWLQRLALGVGRRYAAARALQVIPDEAHATADIPLLGVPTDEGPNRLWREGDEAEGPWIATTLDAFRGRPIVQASRWPKEPDEADDAWKWLPAEALESQEGAGARLRVVRLALLVRLDPTLTPLATLKAGETRFRTGAGTPWATSPE